MAAWACGDACAKGRADEQAVYALRTLSNAAPRGFAAREASDVILGARRGARAAAAARGDGQRDGRRRRGPSTASRTTRVGATRRATSRRRSGPREDRRGGRELCGESTAS